MKMKRLSNIYVYRFKEGLWQSVEKGSKWSLMRKEISKTFINGIEPLKVMYEGYCTCVKSICG